jgi:pimeloyl-ACP methyl ester carboxylesterase
MYKSVTSRGHRIAYRTEGTGTPLVLLGGFSQWADEWCDAGYVDQAGGASDEEIADVLANHDPAALSAAIAGSADWSPNADDVRAPTLWNHGSNDDGGFFDEVLELAARLGVETHLLPGANHLTAFTQADLVLRVVRAFLDKHNN